MGFTLLLPWFRPTSHFLACDTSSLHALSLVDTNSITSHVIGHTPVIHMGLWVFLCLCLRFCLSLFATLTWLFNNRGFWLSTGGNVIRVRVGSEGEIDLDGIMQCLSRTNSGSSRGTRERFGKSRTAIEVLTRYRGLYALQVKRQAIFTSPNFLWASSTTPQRPIDSVQILHDTGFS